MTGPGLGAFLALFLVAVGAAPVSAQADTAPGRPRVGPLGGPHLPQPTRVVLPNGVRVITMPFGSAPKALVRIVIETGPEPAGKCGTRASLIAAIQRGTGGLDATALSDSFAHMGGTLDVSPKPERLALTVDALSAFAPTVVRLLSDIIHAAPFDESGRRTATNDAGGGLAGGGSIDSLALARLGGLLFPTGEFSDPCPVSGTGDADTVGRTRASVPARRASLFIIGRFDERAVARAVRGSVGEWPAGSVVGVRRRLASVEGPRTGLTIVHRPDVRQVAVVVGAAVPGARTGEFGRLRIADALLGGGLTSRITTNIREAKGYAYGPASRLVVAPSGAAYWAEVADVAANVASPTLREIIAEIERLGREAPTADEVDGTVRYAVGRTLVDRTSRSGWADDLEFQEVVAHRMLGRDAGLGGIANVSARDVQRVVQRYLAPRRLAIVVVGDTVALGTQLAAMRSAAAGLRE